MKRSVVKDERVINEKRKITNEAFIFIMIILMGSMLIKQFIFKMEFSEYAVEFICYFGASIYIVFRNINIGNELFSEEFKKGKGIKLSLITGVVVTIVNVYMLVNDGSGSNFPNLIVSFVSAALTTFIGWTLLIRFNERKIKKIESKLDDE